MKTLWLSLIAVFAAVTIGMADADAKRLGGGKSIGKQAPSNTIQRNAAPAAPAAAPASPASQAAAPRAGAAPGAAAAGGSRWMAPLAGLAAGLGLAALASYLGFGEALASFLLIALLAVAVLVAVRFFMARKAAAARPPAFAGGAAYSGLGQSGGSPSGYQPGSVLDTTRGGGGGGSVAATGEPLAAVELPPGFDADGFVRQAKVYFVRLQAAFDAANTNDLREFTSPEMFAELKMQIDEREGADNHTEVVSLHARLLGVETTDTEYLASVRFTGVLREQADGAASPCDEVWNFTRPVEGKGGWVLGGIQQIDPQQA